MAEPMDRVMGWRPRRRALLRSAALGAGGVAAAALLGCGGDDEDEAPAASNQGAGAGSTQTVAQLPGIDVGGRRIPYNFPEPAGKTPKDGGTAVVAVTWEPSVLDPSKSAAGGTVTVPNVVYDRLLGFKRGPAADPFKIELVPELASQWENSPDGLTYTFKIRPGVKWQNVAPLNGRAFRAADVKFAYERYAREGVHRPYFTNMKSVEAPDDSTVKITLNKPQPDFIIPLASRYTTIHPRELVEDGSIDKKLIGTSSMILKDIQAGVVSFTRNPDHWAGKAHLDGFEFRVMTDASAQLAAFRAKQIEFGYTVAGVPPDYEQLVKTMPDVQATASVPTNGTTTLALNLELPKYQDERVRRGLSLALDRNEIINVALKGYGVAMPLLPWIFVFDQQPTPESGLLGKWWKTDRTEAKKLLDAAGAQNIEISMIYYNYSDANNSAQNEIVVNQFRAVGVKLDAKRTDYTEFNSQWVGAKYPDAADGWQAQGFDTDTFFYQNLLSSSPANRWHVKDAQIDEWAEQQRSELNPQRRRELLRKIWDKDLDMQYRITKPNLVATSVYQSWMRGYRSVGALGANSYFYDWGPQVKDIWLDK